MILDRGIMTRDRHGQEEEERYTAKLISFEALHDVVSLMQRVYDALPNKEVLFMDSYDELYEDLEKGAKMIGIYGEEDQLVCFRYVSFPKQETRNLVNDLGMDASVRDYVCQLETTVVDIPYRGNNLQSRTLELMIPIAAEAGYNHFTCTISPYNYFSVKNIMKNGLKVKLLKKKYGTKEDGSDGVWRYILHRELDNDYTGEILDEINVDMTDIDKQIGLLKDGYIGYELDREKEYLKYVKFAE